jgi:Fe2+ or Zn2+ uptake regulation protein
MTGITCALCHAWVPCDTAEVLEAAREAERQYGRDWRRRTVWACGTCANRRSEQGVLAL